MRIFSCLLLGASALAMPFSTIASNILANDLFEAKDIFSLEYASDPQIKLRKVDTVLVKVPGAPHGIAGKPSRMITKIEHTLAWFEKYRAERAQ